MRKFSFFFIGWLIFGGMVYCCSGSPANDTGPDKVIHLSVALKCTPGQAFDMFTKNEHLSKWLSLIADVEPRVNGKYELFWRADDRDNDSTIGCKVLAIEAPKYIMFEWKGPERLKDVMNNVRPLTQVVVFFIPAAGGTEVHLIHTGWRGTPEWERARNVFIKSWKMAFLELERYAAGRGQEK